MENAKIIGKARFKAPADFTRDFYEKEVIPWAKCLWTEHRKELWSADGKGYGVGCKESLISETFRNQFEICRSAFENSEYRFPDDSKDSTCHYSGNENAYMNGVMTRKERAIRRVCCLFDEIMALCSISKNQDPVFNLLESGIDRAAEQRLGIALIQYEKTDAFCVPRKLLDITYLTDYSQVPSHLLTGKAEIGVLNTQLMDLEDKSIDSIKKETEELGITEKKLKQERSDIDSNKVPELAKLQKQMDELRREMDERMGRLKAELVKRENELRMKKKQLENELFLLETQIYAIRCTTGEVYDLVQLRDGREAPENMPLTLFQKVKYMDAELGYLSSVYNVDYGQHKVFERLLQENPLAFETFCPTEKCIVIMRATEHAKYNSYSADTGYTFYNKWHGNKVCIICRDGERLFVLWTDDEHINLSDYAFYQQGKVTHEQVDEPIKVDTKEERASRIFLMCIIQSIIDSGKVFRFPEKVNLLRQSQYINFSFADQYVTDNRFGTLADIQKRCNAAVKKGDKVILLTDLHDSKHWVNGYRSGGGYWEDCDRCRGESNRTKDCKLEKDTLYDISLTETVNGEECQYIRATKMIWKGGMYDGYEKEAAANFRVYANEFLSLAYCNSVWLKYVLTTRNIGNMNNGSSSKDQDYPGLVKAIKVAMEYLLKREEEEKGLIEAHTSLADIEEWQVLLSEWKLKHKVRNINDYQAKRFAAWLEENTGCREKHTK